MKKKLFISLCIMLAIVTIVIIVVTSHFTKRYRMAKEDSFVPYSGAADIYNASREELMELDLCDYSETFGEVKNAKEAYKIAAKVIEEVYGKDESPYIVKFNENANAWIVNGSLPPLSLGGVASIAIDKDTGEILMLLHTK